MVRTGDGRRSLRAIRQAHDPINEQWYTIASGARMKSVVQLDAVLLLLNFPQHLAGA
jgi:hypothetical protein